MTVGRGADAAITREGFADLTTGRQLRTVMRFAHTGEILGVAGQTIAGGATAAAVVLAGTGLLLSLRRFTAWVGRRGTAVSATPRRSAA